MLQKEPAARLGSSDLDFGELSNHQFFHDISWQDLVNKKLQVPWLPDLESETDTRHIDPEFTSEGISVSVVQSMNQSLSNNKEFAGFTYVDETNFN